MNAIEKYNQEVEDYNNAVDMENSISDDLITELKLLRQEVAKVGNLLATKR